MKRILFIIVMACLWVGCATSNVGKSDNFNSADYNKPSDFKFEIKDNGGNLTITITEYKGKNREVNIPPVIRKIPVTSIGDYTFSRRLNKLRVTSVTIPEGVTYIGKSAFFDNRLTNVTIPSSVTSIGNSAFSSNRLTSVTIPEGVTYIGESAFSNNQLTSITIPNSVTSIGGGAFQGNKLTSVTIGNSVTSIGNSAFYNNQLTSVTIPSSVTSIENNAFYKNQLTSVTIQEGVTSIGFHAFRYNQLTSVTIPDSVTTIENYSFTDNSPTLNIVLPSHLESRRIAITAQPESTQSTPLVTVRIEKYFTTFATRHMFRVSAVDGVSMNETSQFSVPVGEHTITYQIGASGMTHWGGAETGSFTQTFKEGESYVLLLNEAIGIVTLRKR